MFSKWENPPVPPGCDHGNSTELDFYKSEDNLMIKLFSEVTFQSVIHLLDQTLLETPDVSEDEELPFFKEPGEIISPSKQKIEQPAAMKGIEIEEPALMKGIEMDDSIITKNLFDYVEQEKRKKILAPVEKKRYSFTKKKRLDKEKKNKKKNKMPKSPNLDYAPNCRRSASPSRSPEVDLMYGRRSGRKSPRYLSPTRRSPSHHHIRRKSPCRYSSARRSPSPLLQRWSPSRRTPSPLLSRWSPSYRSPSPLHSRWSPSCRSPSGSPGRRPFSRRSSSGSPGRRPFSRRSPRHRSSSRRSPSRKSSNRRSPVRRSPSASPSCWSRRLRIPSGSSTYQKAVHRPKCYGSLSPDKNSRRKSPIPDQVPSRKSLAPSPSERRSASLNRYPDGEVIQHDTEQEKKSGDQSQKIPAAKPEVRRLPSKFPNFPADGDYSKFLANEIQKRQLMDDLDEVGKTSAVIGEKSGAAENLGVVVKRETVSEGESNLLSSIKSESPERKKGILNSYYCKVCQLGLNSELTWQSHLRGRKHSKLVRLLTMHEIAKGTIPIAVTPAVVSEDIPRFANPAAGKKRMLMDHPPRLQETVDKFVVNRPLPGLDYLQEIVADMDLNYYCELCDAPCGPSSVMPHLMGYKHQLRCLREISPHLYERNKLSSKKSFENQLSKRLMIHERKYGRGLIKVFYEQDDPLTRPLYDQQPGPSWRNHSSIPDIKREKKGAEETEMAVKDDCLDTSKGDFFCRLCDAHMNNPNMWEAHVRGKRHLKNAKKIPGENVSKVKSVKIAGAVSRLEELIHDNASHELIVGLDFIRETRGVNGEIYNCFLCGSCSTNFDIIEHILLAKHRLRYLEKLVTEDKPNAITTICQMELQDPWFRTTLINEECCKMVKLYGRGKAEVYVSKN